MKQIRDHWVITTLIAFVIMFVIILNHITKKAAYEYTDHKVDDVYEKMYEDFSVKIDTVKNILINIDKKISENE